MQTKITLTGDLGSGKSTVSDILVKAIGAQYYSTGRICRDIAARHGVDVLEMNRFMETHPEIDKEIDDGIAALSDIDEKMIIDSRLAWHFVRESFRVYLSCDPTVAAARVMADKRLSERYSSVAEAEKKIADRKASETKRYREFYHVDYNDLSNYSLVLDATYASPEDVANALLSALAEWELDNSKKAILLCPARLYFPKDGVPLDTVHDLACMLDLNEEIPEVTVTEDAGKFYVVSGAASALAYALNDEIFLPCRLVTAKHDGEYTRLATSL